MKKERRRKERTKIEVNQKRTLHCSRNDIPSSFPTNSYSSLCLVMALGVHKYLPSLKIASLVPLDVGSASFGVGTNKERPLFEAEATVLEVEVAVPAVLLLLVVVPAVVVVVREVSSASSTL